MQLLTPANLEWRALTLVVAVSAINFAYGHSAGGFPPDANPSKTSKVSPSTGTFTNYETAHVHPLDLSPDGSRLAACNTADGHVQLFNVHGTTGALSAAGAIAVGFDPVSVRFRTGNELWVVNHVSDSISIVDIAAGHAVFTLNTEDEPADVAFFSDAGNAAPLAAVSCSRVDKIQVFNANTRVLVDTFDVLGEDPRELASDGTNVYGAIFDSGNSTTIVGHIGGATALTTASNPYGGFNPPFNNGVPGTAWITPAGSVTPAQLTLAGKPLPPLTGMLVRKDYNDLALDGLPKWKDDNGADWTPFVRGAFAPLSRRPVGWNMIDNDVLGMRVNSGTAQLKPGFGAAGYVVHQMNICMALGRNPVSGALAMVGTDATNEIRFEPNLSGRFIRVLVSIINGTTGSPIALVDMNEEHLSAAQSGPGTAYQDGSVAQADRNKSIGDPRGVAFDPSGARIYVTGMGSDNVVVLDASTGQRQGGVGHTIDVGAGPTGVVHHGTLDRLYVLNKFEASISVVNTAAVGSEFVVQTLAFYDPTPYFINTGRVHFYNTHVNSGLGHIACASCHIDGAMDRLAWDLGDPLGDIKPTLLVNLASPGPGQHNLSFTAPNTFDDFHFMKGPMATQTLQDIIGKEPHHWRGDRDGIEEFAGAFSGLQGRDAPLDAASMQEFEDFLSTIHFMPNPFRPIDNSLPGGPKFVGVGTNPTLPLPGHFTSGRFAPKGNPLANGNAWRGFQLYVDGDPSSIPRPADPEGPPLDSPFQCVTCHALPMGSSSIDLFTGGNFIDVPPGPNGEAHLALVSVDGTGEKAFKTPHLRNQLNKVGLFMGPDPSQGGQPRMSRAGFGVLHDGSVAGLDEFLAADVFDMMNDQDVADMVAFVLAINGDDFEDLLTLPGAPIGDPAGVPNVRDPGPDGGETQTAHAAVGKQMTLNSQTPSQKETDLIDALIVLADNGVIDLVVRGVEAGLTRGWYLSPEGKVEAFQSDQNGVLRTTEYLLELAGPGAEITFMAVPAGSGERAGVDRDEDGYFNFSEYLSGTDPADPVSFLVTPTPAARPIGGYVLLASVLITGYFALGRKVNSSPR